ncbi:phosphotransferase [Actinoplanes sp. G11-F43]|uniref:phosphotransferase n=1 Tax=Actinoplanes sp. G11-F43 TaxID=3424130 RepID=UPI003D34F5A5
MEHVLAGGNMGGAVRAGDTVRRTAGPWTPTVQRLLAHLRTRGLTWTPIPGGTDAQGRDVTSYLPGTVLNDALPAWAWSDGVLTGAATLLAELHAATATFDRTGAVWRMPAHEPAEVICHNDFAPYNMVFTGHRLTGVIDWDTVSPGPRIWDVAYLAYRLIPLTDPANREGVDNGEPERARRLDLLCRTYGGLSPAAVVHTAIARLHDLAAFTEARAAAGDHHVRAHVAVYRRDAAFLTQATT